MKKRLSALLAGCLLLSLAACGGGSDGSAQSQGDGSGAQSQTEGSGEPAEDPVEVVVFAAASMEATLTDIKELYRDVAPNVELVFTFDSSGTLRDQILAGATCDLFISAGQGQMNALDGADTTGTNAEGGVGMAVEQYVLAR